MTKEENEWWQHEPAAHARPADAPLRDVHPRQTVRIILSGTYSAQNILDMIERLSGYDVIFQCSSTSLNEAKERRMPSLPTNTWETSPSNFRYRPPQRSADIPFNDA